MVRGGKMWLEEERCGWRRRDVVGGGSRCGWRRK